MSTATTARRTPTHARTASVAGSPVTGLGALLRLNLRTDRVRLVVWASAVGLSAWASVVSLDAAYPTDESLQARAALLSNPATVMMTGPAFALDDYTFGAMVANELSLYVLLAVAIMSIQLAVRHTRAEEESGRLELVRSLPVGRFAPATASVLTVGIANLVVGAALTLALLLAGMEAASSVAFGAASVLTGMVFAGIATVAAQLTEFSRAATGMSMAALALAFLVRGVGDVIDDQGSWLSWFSPFAWAQQTRLYVDLRWWPLLVAVGAVVALYVLAVALARRRDLGAGLRPARAGAATASPWLLSPGGLASRLLSGSLTAWLLGTFFFAVAMGALANELDAMLEDNPMLEEWIALEGTDITAEFAGVILTFVLIAPAVLVVSGVLRLKNEEETGRTEQTIVAGRSRTGYLGGWLGTVLVHTVLLTAAGGIGVGLGVAAGTGETRWIGELLLAALVFLPALLLLGAVAVALLGLAPRLTVLAWLLVVWVSLVLFLGELLDLPDWARDISPFTRTPVLPADDLAAAPLLLLGGLAVVLVLAGFLGFRRRDVATR
jgi:ABC-2 type transport system permease protein